MSPFGLDFGVILGSILGSRTPSPILAKISTAPWREHDFQGSGGSQNTLKTDPKPASDGRLAPRPSWSPPELGLGPFWGPLGEPKWTPEPHPKQERILSQFGGSAGGGPPLRVDLPGPCALGTPCTGPWTDGLPGGAVQGRPLYRTAWGRGTGGSPCTRLLVQELEGWPRWRSCTRGSPCTGRH